MKSVAKNIIKSLLLSNKQPKTQKLFTDCHECQRRVLTILTFKRVTPTIFQTQVCLQVSGSSRVKVVEHLFVVPEEAACDLINCYSVLSVTQLLDKKKAVLNLITCFLIIHNESIISSGSADCFTEPGTYISNNAIGPLSGIGRGTLSCNMQLPLEPLKALRLHFLHMQQYSSRHMNTL